MVAIKKSFILHKHSLLVLEHISDEEAGRLFKAIYHYQMGNEFEMDDLTEVLFSPFKEQFMKDDEKWFRAGGKYK